MLIALAVAIPVGVVVAILADWYAFKYRDWVRPGPPPKSCGFDVLPVQRRGK